MSLLARIRNIFLSPRATRPQHVSVKYSVFLKHTGSEPTDIQLILPIPPGTTPIYSETPEIKTELLYGNEYALWHLKLAPGTTRVISETLSALTQPISRTIPELRVDEYEKNENYFRYLRESPSIQKSHPAIKKTAREILAKHDTIVSIATACNEYVIEKLTYGDPIPGLYSVDQALTKPRVDCGGFDTLLVSLLNACGIPARIASGFWLSPSSPITYNLKPKTFPGMHAWVELLLPDGSWLPADPSVEQLRRLGRSKKIGSLGEIGSDRIVMSYGCDMELDVNNQKTSVDILQTPLIYPATPTVSMNYSISASRL